MKKQSLILPLLAVLLLPVVAFRFGGWAVVTVDDLPEYLVAGTPTALSFIVRQHGVAPLNGLKPRITMTSGDAETTVLALPASERGHYVAALTAPRAGEWSVRIQSGFLNSENLLLPMRAITVGAPAPRARAEADRGHHLFVAKGCVTCHMRGTDGAEGYKFGPDLTGKRYVADYVAKFLDDPESSPLSRTTTPSSVKMPKLNLKEREIVSLVAFLNNSETTVGQVRP